MGLIETEADVEAGLAALRALDPRLAPIIDFSGPVPLRRRSPGFSGMARMVVGQQVSAVAAEAIWRRFVGRLGGEPTAVAIEALADDELKGAGLSTPKVRALRALAEACAGGLDLDLQSRLPAEEAIENLCRVKGIGPWTAEVWLLFSAGHPDIWPGGDLALRVAMGEGLGLGERPAEAVCRREAAAWAPWRGVAARLFWAYYAACRAGREGV
jgi:DNA-3-methyladenine glycosylase II